MIEVNKDPELMDTIYSKKKYQRLMEKFSFWTQEESVLKILNNCRL